MRNTPTLPQTVAESWLALWCQIIPQIQRAALFSGPETDSEYPIANACWMKCRRATTENESRCVLITGRFRWHNNGTAVGGNYS